MFTKQILVAETLTGVVFGPYSCFTQWEAYFSYARDRGFAQSKLADVEISYLSLASEVERDRQSALWADSPLGTFYQDKALAYEAAEARRAREDAAYCGRAR